MPTTPELRYALVQALTKGEPMPMKQARDLVRAFGEANYAQGRFHGDALARIEAAPEETDDTRADRTPEQMLIRALLRVKSPIGQVYREGLISQLESLEARITAQETDRSPLLGTDWEWIQKERVRLAEAVRNAVCGPGVTE